MSPPNADGPPHSTRREFAKTLALLATVPLAGVPAAAEAAAPAEAPTPAEVLLELVRLRYGKHLNDEQVQQVKRGLERGIRSADRLRQTRLKNADEPAFAFSVDVAGD